MLIRLQNVSVEIDLFKKSLSIEGISITLAPNQLRTMMQKIIAQKMLVSNEKNSNDTHDPVDKTEVMLPIATVRQAKPRAKKDYVAATTAERKATGAHFKNFWKKRKAEKARKGHCLYDNNPVAPGKKLCRKHCSIRAETLKIARSAQSKQAADKPAESQNN